MKHLLPLLTLLSLTTATGGLTTTTAHATQGELVRLATHCPGCDTSEPTYNSSAYERRYDAGKYQEGNGQYPRERQEDSNVQRYNRERDRQDNRQDQRRENSQDNSRGYSGGDTGAFRGEGCKSLYGC